MISKQPEVSLFQSKNVCMYVQGEAKNNPLAESRFLENDWRFQAVNCSICRGGNLQKGRQILLKNVQGIVRYVSLKN